MMTISPSSTSPLLTDPSLRDPFFFRFAYTDMYQGDALAQFLRDGEHVEAATVVDNVPSFLAIAQRFSDEFESLGGAVTNEFVLTEGQEDFSVELAAIAAEETDAIIWMTSQGADFIMEARDTSGLEATTLASVEGFQGVIEQLSNAGAAADAEGLVFSLPDFSFLEEEPYLSDLGTHPSPMPSASRPRSPSTPTRSTRRIG